MKPSALFLAFLLSILAVPASAEPGPVGIGFAQAEEGTWWCRDGDPGKALSCALKKCASESGGQECHPTRWCLPAGWSGLMIVWLPEFHSTHIVCGLPGEPAVTAALTAICEAAPEYTRCDLIRMIDPDGNETELAETIEPRG